MSYDSDVMNATSGRGEANWDQIIKLCNRIRDSVGPTSISQAMSSVLRRVKHSDPNVQLHALTLLEACVSNCGKSFQLELTKSAFQGEFKSIITGSYADPRVTQRCKELLVSWANEFKSDSNMGGLIKFVDQLRKDGISFQGLQQSSSSAPPSHATPSSNEDEDLKRAIQMSLRDSNPTPASSSVSSLYPSMPTSSTSPTPAVKKVVKKVRAIYDFEAAEDNELSFRAGEVVTVLDDSDENWWRGETQLGNGLFPASFVSTNLSVNPEPSQQETKSKKKSKKGSKGSKGKGQNGAKVNTDKISLLLDMIKGADVTSEENLAENETLVELEDECKKMRPVVEGTIASIQRKEDEMQAINQKFEEALAMYRKLLAEGPRLGAATLPPVQQQATPTPIPNQPQQQYPTSQQYPSQQATSFQQHPSASTSNPPPYFPPSSSTSLSSLSLQDSQPSLALRQPDPPTMQQLNSYNSAQVGVGPMTSTHMQPSMQLQHTQLPGTRPLPMGTRPPPVGAQPPPMGTQPPPVGTRPPLQATNSLYGQPQMVGGVPSLPVPPPAYHPQHASLYQPIQQPLL